VRSTRHLMNIPVIHAQVCKALLATVPDAGILPVDPGVMRRHAHFGSGADFQLVLPRGRRLQGRLQLMANLTEALGHDVDLVDLREAIDAQGMDVLSDSNSFYAQDADRFIVLRVLVPSPGCAPGLFSDRAGMSGVSAAAIVKVASLPRCVVRVRHARGQGGESLRNDSDLQAVFVLNVIRACATAMDLGAMAVRARRLGIPANGGEVLAILEREGCISPELSVQLRKTVEVCSRAVTPCGDMDFDSVEQTVLPGLDGLLVFGRIVGPILGARQ
jgi:uncharacterized protein YutE (UPF0331/DUF86 family)